MTIEIYLANSLVGANIKAWVWDDSVSIFCKIPMLKAPVFPVPDWAWAIVSFFFINGSIPFY